MGGDSPPPRSRAAGRGARGGAQTYAHDELGALFKEGLAARTAAVAEGGRELAGMLAASARALRIGRAAPDKITGLRTWRPSARSCWPA